MSLDLEMSLTHLENNVREALKSWHKANDETGPLTGLQIFRQTLAETANARRATNKVVLAGLERLQEEYKAGADLLSRHFLDGETMRGIAVALNMSAATAYRTQNEAIKRLTRILQTQEREARRRRQTVLEKRLFKPSYTHLFGVETYVERLAALLTRPEPPWLVSIEGLGGLGKTSLADALARRLIRAWIFDDVGWVSARRHIFKLSGRMQVEKPADSLAAELVDQLVNQLMPPNLKMETLSRAETRNLLRARLKQSPHLIVVDNLETVRDVEALLPTLHDLANPTKFLLTSRETYYDAIPIYHFPLPELREADVLRLIRHEIEQRNLSRLRAAADDDLRRIYQVVGGNPLAVRLVVGQTHIVSLDVILKNLTGAKSRTVEELYTFIYRRAWEALDEPTRQLFLAMPLATDEGERLEDLVALSALSPGAVQTALQRLIGLNLVNSIGDHQELRYTIHNLTRAFLQEQVIQWNKKQS